MDTHRRVTQCEVDLTKLCDQLHAFIDARIVDGKDQLRKYPGHYVTVRQEGGAVYHVSKPGPNCLSSSVLIRRGTLFQDGFNPTAIPYTNTDVYDFVNNKMYVFDMTGDYRVITLTTGGA